MKRYKVVITPFAEDNIREAYGWLVTENETFDCEIRHCSSGEGTLGVFSSPSLDRWFMFFTSGTETVITGALESSIPRYCTASLAYKRQVDKVV